MAESEKLEAFDTNKKQFSYGICISYPYRHMALYGPSNKVNIGLLCPTNKAIINMNNKYYFHYKY
jgi:hypothetical protein